MKTELKAYRGTITKKDFVTELKKHQQLDNFVRGSYWNGEKGCAVGCSLKSISTVKNIKLTNFSDHALYEAHLGIPQWLARLEDTLFEGMTENKSRTWPVDFAQAIKPGANLEKSKVPFLCVVLRHTLKSVDAAKYDAVKFPQVKAAINKTKAAVKLMIKARKSGKKKLIEEADSAARSAAYSAADSAARSAVDSAPYSAYSAAASAAALAAYSAASARSAVDSAAYSAAALAAYSAAYSAVDSAVDSAPYLAASARSAAYDYYADQLLIVLKKVES